jgi:cilia- and flagella-associated protein 57
MGSTKLETVVGHAKGFLVAGTYGYFSVYEKTDDRKDPFMLIKTLRVGEESIKAMALSSNKETVLAFTKSERVLSFSLTSVDMLEEGSPTPFVDLHRGGFHFGAIHAMDICLQRPIVVTAGADKTIRVWNYLRGRCDVVHNIKVEEAHAVACHPAGFQVLAGFKERVRVYGILLDDLKPVKELPIKHCRELKYAAGGHMFACALGITVSLYSSTTLQSIATFTGHIGIVRCLVFTRSDRILYSTGVDGNIHAWDLVSMTKIEEPGSMDSPCPYTGIVVQHAASPDDPNRIACCGNDGWVVGRSREGE